MNKKKIIKLAMIGVGIIAAVLSLAFLLKALYFLWWGGAFRKPTVTDVMSFKSPDGRYSLYYQQVGDPEFPFGKTDVRILLKDCNNAEVNVVDTFIQDDGAIANPENIKCVEWREDTVVVTLQASEMDDREIVIELQKRIP